MVEYNPEEDVANTINDILTNLKCELENIESQKIEEICFHEIVTECVDSATPHGRDEALALIDYIGGEEDIDEGLIDHSCISRMLTTVAYGCLHQEIFNNDFMQELQDELNNEEIDFNKAQELIEKINQYKIEHGFKEVDKKDTEVQIWIENKGFILDLSDFPEPFYTKNQVIDLSGNSYKILTNSNCKQDTVNKNAIVLEGTHKKVFRVYIMDKDKDIDIRDFFMEEFDSIKQADYNLDPTVYTKPHLVGTKAVGQRAVAIPKKLIKSQTCSFDDKKKFLWYINQMVTKLVDRANEKNIPKK